MAVLQIIIMTVFASLGFLIGWRAKPEKVLVDTQYVYSTTTEEVVAACPVAADLPAEDGACIDDLAECWYLYSREQDRNGSDLAGCQGLLAESKDTAAGCAALVKGRDADLEKLRREYRELEQSFRDQLAICARPQ